MRKGRRQIMKKEENKDQNKVQDNKDHEKEETKWKGGDNDKSNEMGTKPQP